MSERRNPQALHEAAAGWREMGKHLDGLVRDLDRHVGTAAAANWHGPAGEAFAGEWHRLKRSVDDSLPAFELAAADLENAAAAPPEDKGGEEHHETAPAKNSANSSSSSGTEVAYGFMALGQLANGLGGAFGKRGGGGGQSRGPVVGHTWETSTAAQGPDPFGPAKAGEARTRGGEGIAKGVRTQPAVAEPAPGEERTPKAGQEKKGTADGPATATAADAPAKDTPAAGGEVPGRPTPDVTQHGAFG
ncbi:WXG100 family type VII secretion target [Streptomyces sp. RPA4-5]|uniref:WXG100 family type VII secretion target n=1 Tax=Streptomyces TaxID=1883 RepID=UPI00143E1BAE|nr:MULTISPECIES: WXG100 family type VII secretion target [Streptomyces]MCX4635839.1 WXG100 family type VII secretion target [Streptomyces platensis]QIY57888.1 WXG100 family type VII secretion target [Streptomyces sp. RPA4-5]WJY41020.1 WXG100 family type VII secretion target [Streptomyces sp. P9-2B-2]